MKAAERKLKSSNNFIWPSVTSMQLCESVGALDQLGGIYSMTSTILISGYRSDS